MSNQRNSNPRYGNGTVTGNLSRTGASGPTLPGPFQKGYGSGLVSLGTAKKPRTASSFPDRKLSVPKPVNLPSLRKENAGNDPNTQLVPSGGGGGWQKPEDEKSEEEPVPNLTAGSSWASAPSASGVPSWQPPQPFPVAATSGGSQKQRNLNPLEYPSLTAAAIAQKTSGPSLQPVPHLPSHTSTGGGNWDEDERKPAFGASRLTTESWADSRVEDEPRALYRPPWEHNGHASSRTGDDHWARSKARFKEVDDPTLFPPPPPPKQPPPPPPRAGISEEEAEAEKRAFEAEIDRVIEEERRREKEAAINAAQEAARIQALEEEEAAAAVAAADLAAAKAKVASLSETENLPPTAEQQKAAIETARQNTIAVRKRREAEEAENERKRKEAAFVKLKELEDRMNARKKQLEEAELEQSAEDVSAEDVLGDLATAVAETVETAATSAAIIGEAAINKEANITRLIEHEGSDLEGLREGSIHGNSFSVQADAGSSVALSESLEAFKDGSGVASDTDSIHGPKESGWNPKISGASQPRAIWQNRQKVAEDTDSLGTPPGLPSSLLQKPHQDPAHSKEQSGAAALFGSSSGFGPSLVATSLGISHEDLASAQKPTPKSPAKPTAQQSASGAPSGPLNWRAVMGVKDPEEPKQQPRNEEAGTKPEGQSGRGRGRARRERNTREPKEDAQEQGGRGRGNRERGRGRGRGRGRQGEGSRGDPSAEASDSLSQSTDHQPHEGGKRANRGRGRGRGAAAAAANVLPPPPPPPPIQGPNEPVIDNDDLPPGMFPQAKPAARNVSQQQPQKQQGVISQPSDESPWQPASTSGQGQRLVLGEVQDVVLDSFADLSIGKPGGLGSSVLDPIIGVGAENRDRAFDRPIDRPKSAAGAVGQPVNKHDANLPNGIPSLPSDLSMEALGSGKPQPGSLSFGFQSGQQSLAPGPYSGVYFSGQQQKDPWQTRPHEPQQNLESSQQSFYKGGPDTSLSPRNQPLQQSSGLQFGAFGDQTFPQFGQLSNSFGQAPFIHTGKQPDWSTGPSLSNNAQNSAPKQTEGSSSQKQSSGPEFNRLDAIVQPSSLNKRGPSSAPGHPGAPGLQAPLGPPGPPGLQRSSHQSNEPQNLLPGDLYSDNASKSPPPPPGLHNPHSNPGMTHGPAPVQPFYYNNSNLQGSNQSRTPRMGQGPFGGSQVNVSFSGPQQQRLGHLPFTSGFPDQGQQHFNPGFQPGPPLKAGLSARDPVDQLPENVFDSNTPRGEAAFSAQQFQPINNSLQGRGRAIDGRGRGGRGPIRAPGPGRGGRFAGRMPGMTGGRGPSPPQHMAMMPNQGFAPVSMPGPIGPGFPVQQGGPVTMGFAPPPISDQMNAKRAPSTKGRGGRGGLRGSQDAPNVAAYGDRRSQ